MPQNIHQNNVRSLYFRCTFDEYYDAMLFRGECAQNSLNEDCIAADVSIDGYDEDTKKLYSTISWSGAVNEGVVLKNIGLTGVDNGFIMYGPDKITNSQFMDYFTGSTYTIDSAQTAFFLTPVSGNSGNYIYPMEVKDNYFAFHGGFFQGFYKLYGHKYQTLPDTIYGNEWNLYFRIRPRTDYDVELKTVNYTYPENSGIFFYMGTRAENKFWEWYRVNDEVLSSVTRCSLFTDGYLNEDRPDPDDDPYSDECCVSAYTDGYLIKQSEEYFVDTKECDVKADDDGYYNESIVGDRYVRNCDEDVQDSEYFIDGPCEVSALTDGYYIPQGPVPDIEGLKTSDGTEFNAQDPVKFDTDNKFITFNHTETGKTVQTYEESASTISIEYTESGNPNLFPLMNWTETGYTVSNIDEYLSEYGAKEYDIYKKSINNAIALIVKEDGRIGYRMMACASGDTAYDVAEEYSKPGMIKMDEWNDIVVKFKITPGRGDVCDRKRKTMRIYIYVGGFLVFVSKPLTEFNFRELADIAEKQEGVPYNISLGGGTQGLMEVIWPNFYTPTMYRLPIEQNFAGSFLGDIERFKFIACPLDYNAVRQLV